MQPNVHLSLESGMEGNKMQKCEYLENETSFLDEIKTFFIVFEGKKLIKNSRHKL